MERTHLTARVPIGLTVRRPVLVALVAASVLCLIALGALESLLLPFWTLLDHLSRVLHRH